MTEPAALQKLLTWLSPAFPVGAFAWSSGLETAIAERRVTDSATLEDWIDGALRHGSARTDAIIVAEAWRLSAGTSLHDGPYDTAVATPAGAGLARLADLCFALTPSAERVADLRMTGEAFVLAARAWPSGIEALLPDPCPYPVAVGAIAAAHGIGLDETLLGFLTAAVHGQVSVAVRLVPVGQTDGLRVMAALEPTVAALAGESAKSGLDAIGGVSYAADIAQMRHETLEPRIFRS